MNRSTKLAGVLAVIGLATSLTLAGPGAARADVIPPAGTWAEIFNPYIHAQGITLCVDDPGGSTDVAQAMDLWRCHGYASNGTMQRWIFTPQGAVNVSGEIFTIYTVKNVASGQCLTVPQTDNPAGLSVLQEPCSGGSPDIYWILEPRDQSGTSPDFQLESEFVYIGHYCMASNTFTDNNGTRLIIEPCNFQDTSRVWNLG